MLSESDIEKYFIQQLQEKGYTYFNGSDISPSGDNPQRENFQSVILEKHFKDCLEKLNPNLSKSATSEAFQKVLNLGTQNLMENNLRFHQLLIEGVTVEIQKEGRIQGLKAKLVDFENVEKNSFYVVNQFVVKENNSNKRFDVVLFVNGLPLVFVELKNPIDEKATLDKAYTQIQNYKAATPSVFYYNALCIISDGIDAKTSSVSATWNRFLAWKSPEKKQTTPLQDLIQWMLGKETLLKLIRYYTFFETTEKKDEQGITHQVKIKKIANYHQYYAVEKAVQQSLKAIDPYEGDRKVGVIWHTQGSGKSLSMVFYSGQMISHPQMKNPTMVIVTDRIDLEEQLFATFSNCQNILRQQSKQAKDRKHLKELLKVAGGGVIFSTIQKFEEGTGELSPRTNIIVVADEAHRSQYGFKGAFKEEANIKYGNAKYLRDALPNASFIGFTGTPIDTEDKSTRRVFGDYIDIYDIAQSVTDGATVPISYEARISKIKFNKKTEEKIDQQINKIEYSTKEQLEKAKKKIAKMESIIGHHERLQEIAEDIVFHFEKRQKVFEGKAMIVAMSRKICINLYQQIIKLKPDWHSDDLDKGKIKIVMTCSTDDPEFFQPHNITKEGRRKLAVRIKDPKDNLQIGNCL